MSALRIQLRRDTAANWVSNNPILLSGELGIETDTLKFKIGNGSRWNATTSYALRAGEANGLATLNSLGKIPSSQLPDSISVGGDFTAAIAALTTNSIAEGSTNKYFTNQRAIDAVSSAITTAIATDSTNRNIAIATAKNEAISAAGVDTNNKINVAKADILATASATASSQSSSAISTAVSSANAYTNTQISAEVSNRNSAINTAISTEITNRNTAINAAVSGIPSGSGSVGPAGAAGPQGPKGDTGEAGPAGTAATLTVGSVTTGAAGTSVSVTNSGTTEAAILNFTIPRGTTGASGTGGSSFSGTTDNIEEGLLNLYYTDARAVSANNQRFTDVYVNLNQSADDLMAYANGRFLTSSSLGNTLDGYVPEADANLPGGYAKLGIESGKILETVIPSTIARTSDITNAIANVVNAAPSTFDTLKEISDYIASDQTAASSLTTLVGTKLSSATAASTYAPIASPTFTGTVILPANTVRSSELNWEVYDSEGQLPLASSKHGMFAHVHGTGSAYYAHAGAWKKIASEELVLTQFAPKASPTFTGTVDFSNANVLGITALPTQSGNSGKYLTTNGNSASWSTLNLADYATKANPVFLGTVDFTNATVTGITTGVADNSITSAKIADGTIVNNDISAAAAISKTKIAGTAVTLLDTATVTNSMLANSFVGINGQAVYLGQVTTIPTGAKTFYNNSGAQPSSGMVAGDLYIQY